jgi:hypothetical protein
MRIAKFLLALIATIAVSSYLSAVSMCLVALAVTPKATGGHELYDIVVNVLFSVPLKGAVIAAPICALFSIVLAIGMVLADRFNVLGSQIGRVTAHRLSAHYPGLSLAGSPVRALAALGRFCRARTATSVHGSDCFRLR